GLDDDTRRVLMDMLRSGEVRATIPREYFADNATALAAIREFAIETSSRQRAYIEELIWAFKTFMEGAHNDGARNNERALNKWVAPVRERAQREWLALYPVHELKRVDWLASRSS